ACGNVDSGSATEIVTMPGRRVWEGRAGVYKYIEVSIGQQKLEAYKAGRKVNESLVSTGTFKNPTPLGDFNVRNRLLSDDMEWDYGEDHPDNYDLDNVPYVMYFNGPYSFHGTYWHSNFGNRMSHGCVNLPTSFAKWLYEWVSVGDPVYIRP
ncbi:MAG: L,D-transpeptidase, partial [Parcubacteria group bacterium]|nr:L,D-transpeptidase [Parcubacteria group bacterium]